MKFFALQLILAFAITGAQCKISFFGSKASGENYNFETLPNHKNFTMMARFIVHNANWTSVAYRSFEKDTFNLSLSTIFSTADGTVKNGTGVPYFFLTTLEPAVKGLFQNDSRCGLMMSLVQTDICKKNMWDAEDPRCARVFLTGRLQKLANNTAEYEFGKKAFSERHPLFVGMPGFHGFFYAKYIIDSVKLISGTGGVRVVNVKDYYQCKDSKFNLESSNFNAIF